METTQSFPVKKTPVILVIIFSMLTYGIYYCAWFLIRRKSLNQLSRSRKIGAGVFIFCILLTVAEIFLDIGSGVLQGLAEGLNDPSYSTHVPVVDGISKGINLLIAILWLIQCFKVKGILEDYLKSKDRFALSLSGLATWFFGAYYLQYRINKIHKVESNNKAIDAHD